MKKIIVCLLVGALAISVFAESQYTVHITQSTETRQVDYSARQGVKEKALKAAVRRYIQRLAPNIQEILIEKAVYEYSHFIKSSLKLKENFTPLGADGAGELVVDYRVEIAHDKVNNFLKENGFSISKGLEIVVLEEPMALGQIQLHTAFDSDSNYFISNYTTIQRRVTEAITKKISNFGFDVKLLADIDLYKSFLTKDNTVSGVYYDVETKQFCRDLKLLKTVKENNPNTIVLYYRLDALLFVPATKTLRVTVAFSMKDLEKNVTKSLGSNSFEMVVSNTGKAVLMDEIAYCAETAVTILLNAEGAADRLNKIAMSIRNSATLTKGPLKIVINSAAFDGKNRKKLMYTLRQELIKQKITDPHLLKATNTTLYATVTHKSVISPDQLYMEYIVPILEKYGTSVDDDHVNYDNNTLTIKP